MLMPMVAETMMRSHCPSQPLLVVVVVSLVTEAEADRR